MNQRDFFVRYKRIVRFDTRYRFAQTSARGNSRDDTLCETVHIILLFFKLQRDFIAVNCTVKDFDIVFV